MPRYYFHIDSNRPHSDAVGEQLADDRRAWEHAIRTMRDLDDGFHAGHKWQLEVRREATPLYHIVVQSRRLDPSQK